MKPAVLVEPLISMGTKEVPLCLNEVRREPGPSVCVKIGQAGGHAWNGDPGGDCGRHDAAPRGDAGRQVPPELLIYQKVGEVWASFERLR